MLEAARPGPIVVLNVSSYRCDALLIEHSGIRLLELSRLSQEVLVDYIQGLETLDTLAWLWDAIVRPVLDALGFTGPPPHRQISSEAHRRDGHRSGCLILHLVSQAIIHSRRRPQQVPAAEESRNIVVVAMQNAPKQGLLKHASDEVDSIVAVCKSMGLLRRRPRPRKTDVLSVLEACRIFHFAGHGSTHPTEPLQSQLLLDDWDPEPFTVASLLETNLTSQRPLLAYLSACGANQMLDEGSIDERIHLANACQLAGFCHVVGTLWSVEDGLCVDMRESRMSFCGTRASRIKV
ncbi:CHAT domain [Fusarium oxysporum f. sp. vasinfectum]|nr:CHAT domain [Fusarium oxysporum f. sp. vasinfectum]